MTKGLQPIAAVVKGLVEQHDSGVYFGSTMALGYHLQAATAAGLIDGSGAVTPLGQKWYDEVLVSLPRTWLVRWADVQHWDENISKKCGDSPRDAR